MTELPSDDKHLSISRTVLIPLAESDVEYVRSGGPGGQNVNKVSSKARVRWPVTSSPSLPDAVKERFLAQYKSRLTNEGDLIVVGQRYRDQKKNYDDCLNRLREMVREVLVPPRPRKATKPSRASQRRRVEAKKQRSDTKRLRRPPKSGE
jgi:ribosome-associated protein